MTSDSFRNNDRLSDINSEYKKKKLSFSSEIKKNDLFSYFPKLIKTDNFYYEESPPSTDCKYGGYFYLIDKKTSYQNKIDSILSRDIVKYKTTYNKDNIIINLSMLNNNIFPIKKCNNYFIKKSPIPYFESYNFGLGKNIYEKINKGNTLYNYVYVMPKDLIVYVIESNSGNFWKKSCKEKRPLSLKEWQHGFSKGFAVSEEENLMVFWVILW